ncbi:hypothetical protein SGPA1_12436 [Streptomyces misionensis JCM 4497]
MGRRPAQGHVADPDRVLPAQVLVGARPIVARSKPHRGLFEA